MLVLGLWLANHAGAKFWLSVMNNLRNPGVEGIMIVVRNGLKGFSEAINAVFRGTEVQSCTVHLLRHCVTFCGWKDRKAVDDEDAAKALDDFEAEGRRKCPFLAAPPTLRRSIHTTNAIESLNRIPREKIHGDRFLTLLLAQNHKTRGSFPADDAATKLIHLAIRSVK